MGTAGGPSVAVVGGGISGLAAAWYLTRTPGVGPVLLLEGASRLGGTLAGGEVAGLRIDTGADRLLAHRPEALALVEAAGCSARLVAPETTRREVLVRGSLRPYPDGVVAGVPTDLTELARSGLLDAAGMARLPLDHVLPRTEIDDDVGVGAYALERLGPEATDRLVAPPLRAAHGGDVATLSLRATAPALYEAARGERSLLMAGRRLAEQAGAAGPRYLGLRGGLATLVPRLVQVLTAAGVQVRTGAWVRALTPGPAGWTLTVGPTAAPELVDVAAVVLALPAAPAARLLTGPSLTAGVYLGEIEYASVATVALAYRGSDLGPAPGRDGPGLPGAGFYVPPSEPSRLLAADYPTSTWGWLRERAGDLEVARVLLGGTGGVALLQASDEALAALAHQELAFVLRSGRAQPVDWAVTRWGGALPQYAVGHTERVATVREALAELPGLAACGAAYDGTGIAACVASAERAVTTLFPTP